jgi:ppGpp synthetase/RelA/SpoT-type nucleotidyltranferase
MHKLTEKYKSNIHNYEDFKIKIEVLIRELLIQNSINFHKIESRVKEPNRLEEKIHRKGGKYVDLTEITDIIGVRIITYFEDEVDKVAKIVETEFSLDNENSIDKRQLDADRFGYKSLHYVVSLTEERKKLTEYKRFMGLKIEIQIRSILQHAWAEIEHDLGYKGEHAIPDILKRNFYRVAAMLETADIEFVNIKNGINQYEKTVASSIKTTPEDVEINSASLRSFVSTSPIVASIEDEMAKEINLIIYRGAPSSMSFDSDIEKLNFLNIKTIKELDIALNMNQDKIVRFAKEWMGPDGEVQSGISLFYLCYVLVGQKNDIDFANKYYSTYIMKGKSKTTRGGKQIVETYNKTN